MIGIDFRILMATSSAVPGRVILSQPAPTAKENRPGPRHRGGESDGRMEGYWITNGIVVGSPGGSSTTDAYPHTLPPWVSTSTLA